MKAINGNTKVLFGTTKDGEKIYISQPSWDCSWYWSFGYLGNHNCHYHLDGYDKGRNINMYDALLKDYNLNPNIEKNLWLFCELAQTAYTLKETAEVLGRGGSHFCTNPFADIIKNTDEVKRINEKVLPVIFNKLNDIYEGKV